MPLRGRVILIDNNELLQADCLKALRTIGFSITSVEDGEQGIEKVRQESFDVALLSLEVRGISGIEIIKKLKQESPNTAVIILKGNAVDNRAEDTIISEAFDCLRAPITPDTIVERVVKAANQTRRALEDTCIGQELERMMLSQVLIRRSEPMDRVARFAGKAATVDTTVLITGEPGTGKKTVARAIHRLSRRSNRRFVTVDCRKSAENLLENELFGHYRSAVPDVAGITPGKIELADGGTLLLDEITGIGPSVQEKLLRVILEQKIPPEGKLPEKKVNIRVISTTTCDMSREMDEGNFREDLFYRLNSIHIPMPPLRERLEDLPLLADYYVRKFSTEKQSPARALSDEAMRFLKRHEWPGNVRELIQTLEYAAATCESKTIGVRDLPETTADSLETAGESRGYLARLEKNEILRILEHFHGNKTRAAKYLGINRKTLREKMERYGLHTKSGVENR
jgi:DNA-binding NtrC family response regulator